MKNKYIINNQSMNFNTLLDIKSSDVTNTLISDFTKFKIILTKKELEDFILANQDKTCDILCNPLSVTKPELKTLKNNDNFTNITSDFFNITDIDAQQNNTFPVLTSNSDKGIDIDIEYVSGCSDFSDISNLKTYLYKLYKESTINLTDRFIFPISDAKGKVREDGIITSTNYKNEFNITITFDSPAYINMFSLECSSFEYNFNDIKTKLLNGAVESYPTICSHNNFQLKPAYKSAVYVKVYGFDETLSEYEILTHKIKKGINTTVQPVDYFTSTIGFKNINIVNNKKYKKYKFNIITDSLNTLSYFNITSNINRTSLKPVFTQDYQNFSNIRNIQDNGYHFYKNSKNNDGSQIIKDLSVKIIDNSGGGSGGQEENPYDFIYKDKQQKVEQNGVSEDGDYYPQMQTCLVNSGYLHFRVKFPNNQPPIGLNVYSSYLKSRISKEERPWSTFDRLLVKKDLYSIKVYLNDGNEFIIPSALTTEFNVENDYRNVYYATWKWELDSVESDLLYYINNGSFMTKYDVIWRDYSYTKPSCPTKDNNMTILLTEEQGGGPGPRSISERSGSTIKIYSMYGSGKDNITNGGKFSIYQITSIEIDPGNKTFSIGFEVAKYGEKIYRYALESISINNIKVDFISADYVRQGSSSAITFKQSLDNYPGDTQQQILNVPANTQMPFVITENVVKVDKFDTYKFKLNPLYKWSLKYGDLIKSVRMNLITYDLSNYSSLTDSTTLDTSFVENITANTEISASFENYQIADLKNIKNYNIEFEIEYDLAKYNNLFKTNSIERISATETINNFDYNMKFPNKNLISDKQPKLLNTYKSVSSSTEGAVKHTITNKGVSTVNVPTNINEIKIITDNSMFGAMLLSGSGYTKNEIINQYNPEGDNSHPNQIINDAKQCGLLMVQQCDGNNIVRTSYTDGVNEYTPSYSNTHLQTGKNEYYPEALNQTNAFILEQDRGDNNNKKIENTTTVSLLPINIDFSTTYYIIKLLLKPYSSDRSKQAYNVQHLDRYKTITMEYDIHLTSKEINCNNIAEIETNINTPNVTFYKLDRGIKI